MVVNEKCLNDFFMLYIVIFMYIAASKVNGNFHNSKKYINFLLSSSYFHFRLQMAAVIIIFFRRKCEMSKKHVSMFYIVIYTQKILVK